MENEITFLELGLSDAMLEIIDKKGYKNPSDIQAGVIPLVLNGKKDIVGQAQTGTGKTASFVIPILEKLNKNSLSIDAIILTPTRELAIQVFQEIESLSTSGIKTQLLYGGQNIGKEISGLKKNPHIVVGTPGRIIDHLKKKRSLDISKISFFVLDEADEMLNIGFKDDIEEIISYTPNHKRVLLFSATIPSGIQDIINKYIKDYNKIVIEKKQSISSLIEQKYYKVRVSDKFEALCRIIEIEFDFYGILFCKTKLDVDDLASKLIFRGYKVEGIHGDIEQKIREKTLARFKSGAIKILVATDVAARGIDVNNLSHVINYSLPDNPETYTHRIGRTGRAGKKGEAISFVTRNDFRTLNWIEKVCKIKIQEEKLPEIKELIDFKKQRLLNNTKELIKSKEYEEYLDLARDLLELGEKDIVLAGILKEGYGKEFSNTHYEQLKPENFGNYSGDENQIRLFVAKGSIDNFTPRVLIEFIEKQIDQKVGDVGKINILQNFSFINLDYRDAILTLKKFKSLNPKKPIIVEAKKDTKKDNNRLVKKSSNKYFRKKIF